MNSGIYTAYSGMKAQMDALDMLANNLANLNTTGFKEQKAFFSVLNQAAGSRSALNSTINNHCVAAEGAVSLADGPLVETQRDLDIALLGNGLLAVETPSGVRYTRNGSLVANEKSVLTTPDGYPVLGEHGRIMLGPGEIVINEQGEVMVAGRRLDRLKLVAFDDPSSLQREGNSLLFPSGGTAAFRTATGIEVRQGFLEQANVNPVLATVRMVEAMRQFEAIQKSVNLLVNEMDAKSIEKLGR